METFSFEYNIFGGHGNNPIKHLVKPWSPWDGLNRALNRFNDIKSVSNTKLVTNPKYLPNVPSTSVRHLSSIKLL